VHGLEEIQQNETMILSLNLWLIFFVRIVLLVHGYRCIPIFVPWAKQAFANGGLLTGLRNNNVF
jgi:hypothetical protein